MKWCIFLEFNSGGIYEIFLLWATWAHEFLSKCMDIARGGVLKDLEVCDFENMYVMSTR